MVISTSRWDRFAARLPLRGRAVSFVPLPDAPPLLTEHDVHLNVRIERPGKEPYDIGEITLAYKEELEDPRAELRAEGVVLALEALAMRSTEKSLTSAHHRLCPMEFTQSMPLFDDVARPTAEAYAQRMLSPQGLGRFLPGWKAPIPYEKPLPQRLCGRNGVDPASVAMWVGRHILLSWSNERKDAAQFKAIPRAAQVLWHLTRLEGRIYNAGVGGFVCETSGHMVQWSMEALTEVGASTLYGMMCDAIPLAVREGASFTYGATKAWWEKYEVDDDLPESLDALDSHEPGGSWNLLATELSPAMAAYAERHRKALIREPNT